MLIFKSHQIILSQTHWAVVQLTFQIRTFVDDELSKPKSKDAVLPSKGDGSAVVKLGGEL